MRLTSPSWHVCSPQQLWLCDVVPSGGRKAQRTRPGPLCPVVADLRISIWLVVELPLWKILISWDYYSLYMEKYSEAPTNNGILWSPFPETCYWVYFIPQRCIQRTSITTHHISSYILRHMPEVNFTIYDHPIFVHHPGTGSFQRKGLHRLQERTSFRLETLPWYQVTRSIPPLYNCEWSAA